MNPVLMSKLSLETDIPLYYQLVNIIRRNITAGTLKPGDVLPSESEMCKNFDISRSTVRQAVSMLEDEGLVVRKQGKGTYVAQPKVHRKTEKLYSFTSEISSLGLTPSSRLVEYDVMEPTPDIMKMLELDSPSQHVYKFSRIRYVDGEALILETSFYPQSLYPNLTRPMLEAHSFYSLLYEQGIVAYEAVDSYEAVVLSRREAELLGCRPGSSAFAVQRVTRTENGQPYEFTQSLIRGDRVKLDVYLRRDGVSFSRNLG
ncbi:MAG: GntR family transcriptional regulator [Oscillospiraceae bacterium]|nr:GntR family transcriptional regulator [Oscillospiraceae bacterium]